MPEGATLPGKKWFSNFDAAFVSERRRGLQEYLRHASPRARCSTPPRSRSSSTRRAVRLAEQAGAVDLDVHDCPHLLRHGDLALLRARHDRREGLQRVCLLLRSVSEVDPETQKPSYVHTVVSAIVDVEAGTYHAATVLDQHAPAVLRNRLRAPPLRDQTIVAATKRSWPRARCRCPTGSRRRRPVGAATRGG